MNHFKDFLIKLQTIDIKITKRIEIINNLQREITYYDISHQNPSFSGGVKNELKELGELAITDILNLSREQVNFQLLRFVENPRKLTASRQMRQNLKG